MAINNIGGSTVSSTGNGFPIGTTSVITEGYLENSYVLSTTMSAGVYAVKAHTGDATARLNVYAPNNRIEADVSDAIGTAYLNLTASESSLYLYKTSANFKAIGANHTLVTSGVYLKPAFVSIANSIATLNNRIFVGGDYNSISWATSNAAAFRAYIDPSIGSTAWINAFNYHSTTYMAGSNNGYVYTSPDAITWTSRSVTGSGGPISHIVSHANYAVVYAGIGNGSATGRIAYSTGLTSYTTVNTITNWATGSTSNSSKGLAYSGSMFAATYDSTNGIYASSPYYGQGRIAYSSNAITWTSTDAYLGPNGAGNIVYGNSKFLAISNSNTSYPHISQSTDGITWTNVSSWGAAPTTTNGVGYTGYAGNLYFIGKYSNGNGLFLISKDGQTWNRCSQSSLVNSTAIYSSFSYNSGVPTNKYIVTVASSPTSVGIAVSTDGITWGTAPGSAFTNMGNVQGVISGPTANGTNNAFIAFGIATVAAGTGICTSTDGTTWTTRNSTFLPGTTSIVYKVTYQPLVTNAFVAVGSAGQIRTSTDGTTWTTRTSNFGTTDLRAVASNGLSGASHLYMAVGYNAANSFYTTSTDGITWTTGAIITGATANFADTVYYTNGGWVVGNANGITAVNNIVYSTNGSTWSTRAMGLANLGGSDQYLQVVASPTKSIFFTTSGYMAYSTNISTGVSSGLGTAPVENLGTASATYISLDFTNNLFLIQAYDSANTYLYSSTDGITWTQRTVVTGNANSMLASQSIVWHTGSSRYYTATSGLGITGGTTLANAHSYSYNGVWTGSQAAKNINNTTTMVAASPSGIIISAGAIGQTYSGGILVVSTDNGITWTTANPGFSTALSGLSYANGIFFAHSMGGSLAYSTNGTTWSAATGNVTVSSTMKKSVVYSQGNYWTGSQYIYYSTNGTAWQTYGTTSPLATTGTTTVTQMAAGDGLIAFTDSSNNYRVWDGNVTNAAASIIGSTGVVSNIVYSNGMWAGLNTNNAIVMSSNPFTLGVGGGTTSASYAAAWTGVSVMGLSSGDGNIIAWTTTSIFTAADGKNWSPVVMSTSFRENTSTQGTGISDIAASGGNLYVATKGVGVYPAITVANSGPTAVGVYLTDLPVLA